MFTFRLLACTLLAFVLTADGVLLANWETARESLSGMFGLELGLALFFNFLGALLVVELVHESGARPRWLEWYRSLPATRTDRVQDSPDSRGLGAGSRVCSVVFMTVFFYSVDSFVLPLVPASLRFPVDLAAIASVAFGVIGWRSLRRLAPVKPEGPER